MFQKKEVIICLGSSCFARGNKHMVQEVKRFVDEHNIAHKINFKGKHCFGNCENGPCVQIDGRRYDHFSEENLESILTKELL